MSYSDQPGEINANIGIRRVLCVDDDPVAQRLLMTMLARPGWAVECVCDGQEAIDRFQSAGWGFDVLVTDHAMPRLDGRGLVNNLRSGGFTGGIVLVTAYVTPAERRFYMEQGITTILIKPLRKELLCAAVDRAYAACALPS